MKTLSLITLITLLTSFTLSSPFEKIMKENIDKVYKAQSQEELNEIVNAFNRIAQKETNKWEPLYYASFGYLKMTNNVESSDEKDRLLDQALEKAEKGLTLSKNEDELLTMVGYIHMLRVSINPGSRGQKYSGLSMQAFNKALAIDPENPRALYLLGRMEMGVAQFFGSDVTDACTKVKKSLELFENQTNQSSIAPTWGANQAKKVAEYCN